MSPSDDKGISNGKSTADKSDENQLEDTIPTPPDGGWGWVITFSAMMCNVIVDGLVYVFGIFLPEFVNYFDASRTKVSLIGSVLVGVYMGEGPIVSGLINKFGCRPVVMAGSIISTIAFVGAMFSPSVDVLILTYGAVGGVGFGMIYIPSIVIVGHYFERKRGLVTGIAVCGSGVGTFVLAPLIRFLLDYYDWRNTILIVAGIVLNTSVCGALMRPLEPVKRPKTTQGTKTAVKYAPVTNGTTNEVSFTESDIIKSNQFESVPTSDGHGLSQSIQQSTKKHEKPYLLENGVSQEKLHGTTYKYNNEHPKQFDIPNGIQAHEVDPLIRTGSSAIFHSQPIRTKVLTRPHAITGSHQHLFRPNGSVSSKDLMRPMYRKDIFYSGSVVDLSEFKSQPDLSSYITSITNIPSSSGRPESKIHKMFACMPKSMADIIFEMLDVSLFTDIRFICVCLGNFLAFAGYFVPFVYLVDRAILSGIDKTQASLLLSIIGVIATIGRLFAGALANLRFVNSQKLNCACMFIAGVSIYLLPIAKSYPLLVVISSVFGLTSAAFISLTSIIICDLLGLEKLTNAFGVLTMVRGISIVIGPPTAGSVFRSTGSYDASFYLGGSLFIAGALLHCVLLLPCMQLKNGEPRVDKNKLNSGERETEVTQQ